MVNGLSGGQADGQHLPLPQRMEGFGVSHLHVLPIELSTPWVSQHRFSPPLLPPQTPFPPSGRIGVAAVTAGPGVTNAVTAIKNAQMAESPLLLIGGAAASLQKVCRSHLEPLYPISFYWGRRGGMFSFLLGFGCRDGGRCRTSTSCPSSGRCARPASRCAPSVTSSPRCAKPSPRRSQGPQVQQGSPQPPHGGI